MGLPPKPWLLHPVAVHFPIALLTVGWGVCAWSALRAPEARAARPAGAASGILWLGTAAAWAAMGLGLWAQDSVPHVPEAWRTMNRHRTLAFWTVGAFTALSAWRYWGRGRGERLFLAAWLAATGVLLATGYYGGELVFALGVGVQNNG